MKKLLLILSVMIITSAANAQKILEPLYGYLQTEQGLAIQVYSGGCTYKQSFTVEKTVTDGVTEVYFLRIKPDFCKALYKNGTLIHFTYEEMGLLYKENFRIMNPKISVRKAW